MNTVGIGLQGPSSAEELASVNFGAIVALDRDGVNQVASIRSLLPESVILLRVYEENIILRDPESWADYCASVYANFQPYTRHIVPANETNIEGGRRDPAGYQYLNQWMMRWITRFRSQVSDAIIHFPAISPSPTEHSYVGQYCAESVSACNVLDVHTYWGNKPLGEAIDWYFHARSYFPNHWTMLTEYNRVWDHGNYSDGVAYGNEVVSFLNSVSADPGLIAACAFLWDTPYENHRAFAWRGQPVVDIVRNMQKPQSYWTEASGYFNDSIPEWLYLAVGAGVVASVIL